MEPKDLPAVNLEEVIGKFVRNTSKNIDELSYEMSDNLHDKVRRTADKLRYKFIEYKLGARYIDEYVCDELRNLHSSLLKNEFEKMSNEFMDNFNRARREIEEIRERRLKPEEIASKMVNIKARFCSSFVVSNPTWIEGCIEEFLQNFIRRYDLKENFMVKYEVTKICREFSDAAMDEYYQAIRNLLNGFTENFVKSCDEVELGLKQQEESLNMIEDPTVVREQDKVIETEGKSQEELYNEKQAQLESVMSDNSLTIEQRSKLYDEVSARYDAAIAGLPADVPTKTGESPSASSFFL